MRDRRQASFHRQRSTAIDYGGVVGASAPLLRRPEPLPAGTIEIDLVDNPTPTLLADRYYLIHCTAPITVEGGIVINGNGCDGFQGFGWDASLPVSAQTPIGGNWDPNRRRAVFAKDYKRYAYIEGVKMGGVGCAEGMDHDTRYPNTTFIAQNVRVAEMAVTTGEATGWGGQHPDGFQTWGGPTYCVLDRWTIYTPYQGMFFQPKQFDSAANIAALTLSRVNVVALPQSPNTDMSLPYQFVHDFPLQASQVYGAMVAKNPPGVALAYAGQHKLQGQDFRYGLPAGGDFAPAGVAGAVGVPGGGSDVYVSPGYLA